MDLCEIVKMEKIVKRLISVATTFVLCAENVSFVTSRFTIDL